MPIDKYTGIFVYLKKLLKKISLNLSKSFQKEIKKPYNNSTLRLVPKKIYFIRALLHHLLLY